MQLTGFLTTLAGIVVGAAAVIESVRMDRVTQLFNFPAMLIVMMLLFWTIRTYRRVSSREGAVLLVLYGVYIAAIAGIAIVMAGAGP